MSVVERTRANHEKIEQLERLVASDLLLLRQNSETTCKRRQISHRIRKRIEDITRTTLQTLESYEDRDGAMEEEVAALGGGRTNNNNDNNNSSSSNNNNLFVAFYDRMKEIRDGYRSSSNHHQHLAVDSNNNIYNNDDDESIDHLFSGEEAHGRYLDLHELHNIFNRSKFVKPPIDYTTYLDHLLLSQPRKNKKMKKKSSYLNYLEKLLDYLTSFVERSQPLHDLQRTLSEVEATFEHQWAKDNVLQEDNLSTRLWREISLKEAMVKRLCHLLEETIARTKENATKKLSLTYQEIEAERQDDQDGDEDEDEDEDDEQLEIIHNPLKIPMGCDGKPIPYWLYKLHGLGHRFDCEICGNHTYWGRRSFERHFNEARHLHGLHCLGITGSNKSFHEVTSISEARKLWQTMQEDRATRKWSPDVDEEFEDDEGNVYIGKTYYDLKRQRLV